MKLFQKNELKLVGGFYLEYFLSCLFFFIPAFWVLQLQESLTLTQIGILFTVISVSSFLFEIPTGAFADLYGRKASTIFGYVLQSLAFLLIFFFNDFYSLFLIFVLWGFAGTFISGAREAWIIDRLKYHKQKKLIKDYYIKNQSITRFSLFLSGILGAIIVAKLGLNIIWVFAAASYFISVIVLFFIPENKVSKPKRQSFKKIFSQAKKSIKFSLNHRVLFLLLLATFFIMLKVSFSEDLVWQPFLKELNFPIYALGFLFSGVTLIGTFIPFLVKPILKKFKKEVNYLAFLLGVSTVLCFLVLFVNGFVFAIILFLLLMTVIDLSMPVNSDYMQKHIPSKMRATVLSFMGMIVSFSIAIGSPIAGLLADTIGLKYTIALGGIFMIPAIILYLRIKEKGKK